MKRLNFFALFCATAFLLFSCKKADKLSDPYTPNPVGKVTAIGDPDATPAVVANVGAAGGVVQSSDDRLTVIIPEGALATDQQISIKTISNKNPLGKDVAYRLLPHGVQFAKPVTIRYAYTDDDLQHTLPEALAIAYQDEKGIWQAKGGPVLNKTEKTVSVTTTHFSDWSFFESFRLYSTAKFLPVNGTSDLEVWSAADLVVPLDPSKQVPIGQDGAMTAAFVKQWSLAGGGTLTPNKAKAVYKAPGQVPATNPVAVSVRIDLKERGTFLLVANITIVSDDGEIEVRVNGGPWRKKVASPAVKFGDNYYGVADSDGDEEGSHVFITWVGGLGLHPFKDPTDNQGTHTHFHITGVDNYTCGYINEARDFVASGGGVTITDIGTTDGFVRGTFDISPAGCGPNLLSVAHVEGKFRVKKTW